MPFLKATGEPANESSEASQNRVVGFFFCRQGTEDLCASIQSIYYYNINILYYLVEDTAVLRIKNGKNIEKRCKIVRQAFANSKREAYNRQRAKKVHDD